MLYEKYYLTFSIVEKFGQVLHLLLFDNLQDENKKSVIINKRWYFCNFI